MGGWGWGNMGVWRVSHACTPMHAKHDKHAKHGCLHVGGHLEFLYMFTCVCVYVCAFGDTPDATPTTCPLPRAEDGPKHQNSISPELIEII